MAAEYRWQRISTEASITMPASDIKVEHFSTLDTNAEIINNSNSEEFIYDIPFSSNNDMVFGMFKITAKEGYYFNNIAKPHIKVVNNSNYKVIRSNDIYNDNNKLISRSFTISCNKDDLFSLNGTDKISFSVKPIPPLKPKKLEILDFYPVPQITNRGDSPQPGDTREIVVLGVPGAKFSVKLIDSDTNYSILSIPYENIEIPTNGKFVFEQSFPNSLSKKTYYMDITPGMDTVLNERVNGRKDQNKNLYGVYNQLVFHQYPNVSMKFTKTNDTLLGLASPRHAGTLTLSGTDILLRGRGSSGTRDATTKTIQNNAVSWTVSSSRAIYINGSIGNSEWVSGPTTKEMIDGTFTTKKPIDYTKKVVKRVEKSNKVFLSTTKDLVIGMNSSDIPVITKDNIKAVYYESADPYDNNKITDKLQLKSVSELKCGMKFGDDTEDEYTTSNPNASKSIITGIDTSSNIITVSKKTIWPAGVFVMDFWYEENSHPSVRIKSIDCDESITIDSPKTIEPGTKLTFSGGIGRSETRVNTNLSATGSGTTSITISGYVDVEQFGEYDTVQSLNVEDFLTDKPNVSTQQVKCPKGTVESNPGIVIDFTKDDTDGDVATKTVTIVHSPTKGTLATIEGAARSKTYTPFLGFTGTDELVFKVANAAGTFSDEAKVYITIE